MRKIFVVTEGATEREVGKVLYDGKILSHEAKPQLPEWSSTMGSQEDCGQEKGGQEDSSQEKDGQEKHRRVREGSNVIPALKNENFIAPKVRGGKETRVLLVFDQEESSSPLKRAKKIETQLKDGDPSNFWVKVDFQPIGGFDNLFEHKEGKLHIVLHISSAHIDGINNRDFDGYILKILQGKYGKDIIKRLASQSISTDDLIRKAEKEITELMRNNGFPWTHAKSWLYAYITVLQYRQSHVSFSRKVVEEAIKVSKDYVAQIFKSLVFAWNKLATEELQ